MNKSEYLNFLAELIQPELSFQNGASINKYPAGEHSITFEDEFAIFKIYLRFRISSNGIAPSEITALISNKKLEEFIKPIAISNQLEYSENLEHSIANSVGDKNLYRQITVDEINGNELKSLSKEYLEKYIIPFFIKNRTIEGIGGKILNTSFKDLINIGVGGKYPIGILKSITIAKWLKNEDKFEEFVMGFKTWIEEDKNDPNLFEESKTYESSLNEILTKISAEK